MKEKQTSLFSLFFSFASIGAITFGGGYAMLPFLERELCEKKKWVNLDEVLDYYALGQCTPGVIAINMATFVGYEKRGFPGAVAASIGIITPSVVIITIISALFMNFQDNLYVSSAIAGIKVVVCALMANTIYTLVKKSIIDKTTFSFFVIALLLLFIFNFNIIVLIILSVVFGLGANMIKRKVQK